MLGRSCELIFALDWGTPFWHWQLALYEPVFLLCKLKILLAQLVFRRHHSTTCNILWITCKSLHSLMLRGRRPAVVGVLCAPRGDYFWVNYKGLARRQTKDLLFNFMWKVNKLPVHNTLKASLWLCMGCAQTVHGCARAVPVTHKTASR